VNIIRIANRERSEKTGKKKIKKKQKNKLWKGRADWISTREGDLFRVKALKPVKTIIRHQY
jgi:hypothetical protein